MVFSATDEKEVKKFLIIFYMIGVLGMLIPKTFVFFTKLIPFSLLLNFFYLAYFHPNKKDIKPVIIFSFILLAGLIVEIIGVNTVVIFGEYRYGSSLGLKVFETPVLIGFNWLFLTYTTSSIFEKFKYNAILKVVLASVLMLFYDVVLEQVAPKIGMWSWESDSVPLQNYVMWFALAFLFHSIIKVFKIKTTNPLSLVILGSQFAFFIILLIFLR